MSGAEVITKPRAQGTIVRLMLELFHQEIRATANAEEEHHFLRAVGAGLAHRFPIAARGGVSLLENDLNRIFASLGLGRTRISVAEDGLEIRHQLDSAEVDGEPILHALLPATLEGAYDAWLRTLGSGPRLQTRLISDIGQVIIIRHGL